MLDPLLAGPLGRRSRLLRAIRRSAIPLAAALSPAAALSLLACNTAPPAPMAASATSAPPASPPTSPATAAAPATPAAAPEKTPTAGPGATPDPASAKAEPADDLVGKPAPDFTASSQDGKPVHLAALQGKPVVLYFYPKDETPGCTKEACSFRDAWDALAKTGAVLIGVSADSAESHKSFAANHKLPFVLVSDPEGAIAQKYGVPFQGRHHRETFVIGANGKIEKVYRQVDVTVHAQQVLADLTAPHPA